MTRFEKHSPLHPICAILITYRDGTTERNEFGSHAAKGQRMMHLHWDLVESVEEVPVDDNWKSIGEATQNVIKGLQGKINEQ